MILGKLTCVGVLIDHVLFPGMVCSRSIFSMLNLLVGGAIGSTTAMSISGFLLGLILIIPIVLVRRAKGIDDEDWMAMSSMMMILTMMNTKKMIMKKRTRD